MRYKAGLNSAYENSNWGLHMKCPNCKSNNTKVFTSHYLIKEGIRYHRCLNCDTMFSEKINKNIVEKPIPPHRNLEIGD